MLKIYLAGPEVFHPDALAIGARKKEMCLKVGFEGLFPFDNEVQPADGSSAGLDELIYRENLAMMRVADLGVFNLTPFRGLSADVGTVFELGAFVGMGKPVFGYSNDPRSMLERVQATGACNRDAKGWTDGDSLVVEDFGNPDNLMITSALVRSGSRMVLGTGQGAVNLADLDAFRRCLEVAARLTKGER